MVKKEATIRCIRVERCKFLSVIFLAGGGIVSFLYCCFSVFVHPYYISNGI